jgi:hypothetical protein
MSLFDLIIVWLETAALVVWAGAERPMAKTGYYIEFDLIGRPEIRLRLNFLNP